MIDQFLAKTKWFLRDTSPLLSFLIFVLTALLISFWLIFFKKEKKLRSILFAVVFSISLTGILMFTLLRKPDAADYGFEYAFHSLPSAFVFGSESSIVFGFNILLFVPFAFVLRWKISVLATSVTCVVLSVCIELAQMIFRLGIFEIADILGNCLGAVIGMLLCLLTTFLIDYVKKNES